MYNNSMIMTMRLIAAILLLSLFLQAGEINYRAVLLPPETQTAQRLTFTLAVRTEGDDLLVSAHIRNDSDTAFALRSEQVSLGSQRPRDFQWRPVLPDAAETISWRLRCVSGNHTLRILDLEFPLLIKAGRAEIPYYIDKNTAYDFSDGKLRRLKTGAGLLIIDTKEEILDAILLKPSDQRTEFIHYDFAHWLITRNVSLTEKDLWLLIKTKVMPEVYQVFDLQGRPVL